MSKASSAPMVACLLAVVLWSGVASAALVPNGGFETGTMANWRVIVGGANSITATSTPADVYDGTYAGVLTRSDFGENCQLDKWGHHYHIDAGKSYRFSFATKKLSGDADAYLRTTVKFFDASFNALTVFADAPITPGANYALTTYYFSIPEGDAHTDFYMSLWVEDTSGAGSSTASYAIDNIDITEVPEIPPPTAVPNGGFETGDFQVWRTVVPGGSAVVTADPADVYEKFYAAVLTRTDFTQNLILDKFGYHYHLDTGKSYEASWAAKKISGEADAYLKVSLAMFGPAPTYEPKISVLNQQPFTPGSDYGVTTQYFAIPAGSVSTDFYILFTPEDTSGAGSAPAVYAVDNVNVIEVEPPPPAGTVILIQ